MKELTCIVCPNGCRLKIDSKMHVTGAECPRGITYALKEILSPERMLTSTVAIKGADISRLPVKTSAPIPKGKMMDVMKIIRSVRACAPIKQGDILVSHVCNLDVDIVATRSLFKKSN